MDLIREWDYEAKAPIQNHFSPTWRIPICGGKEGLVFWKEKTVHHNKRDAKEYIVKQIKLATSSRERTIVLEYSELDLLSDKLKGIEA